MVASVLQIILESGVTPALLVGITLWNADKILLSDSGAKVIFREIKNTTKSPDESGISMYITSFLESYFSLNNGLFNFYYNVFIFTVVSLLVMLSIYTSQTTGLFDQLLSEGFLWQFIANGFVVTYLVNFFVFSYHQVLIEKISLNSASKSMLLLFWDILTKIALFLFLTMITYVLFAEFRGAFSGDIILAINSIPNTLFLAIQFGNLSSVYFYSIVISSFPIFIVAIINIMAANPGFSRNIRSILFWLPFESKPLRAIGSIFAIFIGMFALLTSTFLTIVA